MERAALNTVIGMGTVFIVLIFISLLIYCFRFINIFENKMKKSEKPAEEASAPAAVPVEEPAEDLTDDRELVAVITAAIAASEGVRRTAWWCVPSRGRRHPSGNEFDLGGNLR